MLGSEPGVLRFLWRDGRNRGRPALKTRPPRHTPCPAAHLKGLGRGVANASCSAGSFNLTVCGSNEIWACGILL
jgi:hypothetical protein